jgi:hypothetical protein
MSLHWIASKGCPFRLVGYLFIWKLSLRLWPTFWRPLADSVSDTPHGRLKVRPLAGLWRHLAGPVLARPRDASQ